MSSDLYVVIHLPKTAGTTLLATFRANFPDREWLLMSPPVDNWQRATILSAVEKKLERKTSSLRCVFGHWTYFGIHERIRPEANARYITFLRDPVERCVSLYSYIKTRPANQYYEAIVSGKLSLGQWLEQGEVLELHNDQTRRLCFDASSDVLLEPRLTRDHLELAKERLRAFWGSSGSNYASADNSVPTSQGYNLSDDATGPTTGTGDKRNVRNLNLSPLADNGGPTQTIALLAGSAAIDAGNTTLTTDQRGFKRPSGKAPDIGAFELLQDPAQTAPNFLVNKTDDHDDGACTVGDCTLREAINASNTAGGTNNIKFDATAFAAPRKTITLSLASGGTATSLPAITNTNVTITAPSAGVIVTGTSSSNLFTIQSGNVTLDGLTINNGAMGVSTTGGRTLVENCTLSRSTFNVFNNGGTDTVQNCTLTGAMSRSINNLSGTLTATNCTISGNTFSTGVFNNSGATLNLSNSLIAGARPTSGTITDGGFNLASGSAAGAGLQTNSNGNPVLADNGGRTQTIALLPSSPAINAGNSPLRTDQRGSFRPVLLPGKANAQGGNGSDIGAFELDQPQAVPNLVVNTTNDHDDGACTFGDCSLREAINASNTAGGTNAITFDPTVFAAQTFGSRRQTITLRLPDNAGNADSLPFITSNLSISAPPVGVVIESPSDTTGSSAIFDITANVNVTLSDLTIQGSSTSSDGVLTKGGTTLVRSCTVSNNKLGLETTASGTMTVRNSTVYNNSTAGIFNSGTSTVESCTITGNGTGIFNQTAQAGTPPTSMPGPPIIITPRGVPMSFPGIPIFTPGTPARPAGTVNLANSLVVGNTSSNTSGAAINDQGANRTNLTAATAGLDTGGNSNGNAVLGEHGGLTQTVALVAGSVAIDNGNTPDTNDQRGRKRPTGPAPDMGAFEYDPAQSVASGLVVSTTDDHDDGVCGITDCTLREALNVSNNNSAGTSTITFDANVFSSQKNITLQSAFGLGLSKSVTITGPTAGVTIVANPQQFTPTLSINGNVTANLSSLGVQGGQFSVSNSGTLVFTNGSMSGAQTDFQNLGTATLSKTFVSNSKTGIDNNGALTLQGCSFFNNGVALNNENGSNTRSGNAATANIRDTTICYGGTGILNGGTLTLNNSTLNNNSIALDNQGTSAVIVQCTFVGNTHSVDNSGSAALTLNRSTAAGNGQGLSSTSSVAVLLRNTLLVSNGTNLSVSSSLAPNSAYNLTNITAQVAGLQTDGNGFPILKNNGGPTSTVALIAGSPAINGADPGIYQSVDQRETGFLRVVGGRADIGAFEFQGASSTKQAMSSAKTKSSTSSAPSS